MNATTVNIFLKMLLDSTSIIDVFIQQDWSFVLDAFSSFIEWSKGKKDISLESLVKDCNAYSMDTLEIKTKTLIMKKAVIMKTLIIKFN